MTTFLLVRHGEHDLLGKALAGRCGIELNDKGARQAQELVQRLERWRIDAIYSSPQPRARKTAEPLARQRQLSVRIDEAFDEIDFGEWTGLTFERLRQDEERWREWVERKSSACPPGGEPFAQATQRAVAGIEKLERRHPGETVVVTSHGDVVKAVLASYLGLSLDHLQRFEIAPASVSVLETGAGWWQVKLVNGTAEGLS